MYQRALYKAIHYFGSQKALAHSIGVKQQAISNWLNREQAIPYKQVLKIVAATKGYVTYHELAPEEKCLNQILDEFIESNLKTIKIPIENIQSSRQLCFHEKDLYFISTSKAVDKAILHQPLLVDEDFYLIGCECQLMFHKTLGHTKVRVKVVHR